MKKTRAIATLVVLAGLIAAGGTALAVNGIFDAPTTPTVETTVTATPTATAIPSTPPTSTPPTSTPQPSTPPASTPPASTPTASGRAYDPADLSTWVISYSGIGPVALDRPLADVRAEVSESEDSCQPEVASFFDLGVVGVVTDPDAGLIAVATTGSNLTIESTSRPHTDAGITTGSTYEQLLTAYPAAEAYTDSNGRPGYRLTDGTSWIHFTSNYGRTIDNIDVSRNLIDLKEYCG